MNQLEAKNVSFSYRRESDDGYSQVLDDFSIVIPQGQFLALLGSNGSGKSTLAKLFNALLVPTAGEITVNGISSGDEEGVWSIRRLVGMVFQDPTRQIVASVVEDDVAFGPENLGIDPKEIRKRVTWALQALNIEDLRLREAHYLSGGQKQRVAIAGILAMKPSYIILDEPTAMLDPQGRREVLKAVQELRDTLGLGIVYITHHMDEALFADRVVVLDNGRIRIDSSDPHELFADCAHLAEFGLQIPPLMAILTRLRQEGLPVPIRCSSVQSLADWLHHNCTFHDLPEDDSVAADEAPRRDEAIALREVSYTYMQGTPFVKLALDNVSLSIYEGECLGIIGATGSGKSTFLQLLNGLLRADSGELRCFGKVIPKRGGGSILASLREMVGFLFQFSEQQLFETTVFEDIAFAPKNLGLTEAEVRQRVEEAMDLVKLDPSYGERSPLALSGGEMRRVALAGVLSARPRCLVLDEPTVGLDPQGAEELLNLLRHLNQREGMTIIITSHRYHELANLTTRLVLLNRGRVGADAEVRSMFYDFDSLSQAQVEAPEISSLIDALWGREHPVRFRPIVPDEAVKVILKSFCYR